MKEAREILIEIYLDYVNNYLTIERYAEHNGLTFCEAEKLIELAGVVNSHPHPEA